MCMQANKQSWHSHPIFTCRSYYFTLYIIPDRMAENIKEATKYIEQGHVRVGPEVVKDPAFLVTRSLEDFVTWVDGSAIRKHVLEYNDMVSRVQNSPNRISASKISAKGMLVSILLHCQLNSCCHNFTNVMLHVRPLHTGEWPARHLTLLSLLFYFVRDSNYLLQCCRISKNIY